MRRWLLVLLMLFLPLQFSWAVAATYCTHEPSGAATGHFGHHEHHHPASGDLSKDGSAKLAKAVDSDCEVCHLGACEPVLAVFPSVDLVTVSVTDFTYYATYDSHVPPVFGPPDRSLAV